MPSHGAQNLAKDLDTIIMVDRGNKPVGEDAGNSRDITNGKDHDAPEFPARDGSLDPESDDEAPVVAEELQHALTRPPVVIVAIFLFPGKGGWVM